jgi:energy-coupling factor transport system substrate-specific component
MVAGKKGWQLKDVIMIGILGVIFAAIYLGAFYLSQPIGVALTPLGLAPFSLEVVYGVWFMAATIAAFIMQKPGVAFVTEVLAAFLELLMGNFPLVITTGLVQGAGLELGFAVFGYKKYNLASMCVSAAFACIISFVWTYFVNDYSGIVPSVLIGMFIVRLATSLLFAGVISWLLGKGLARTGVLKGYPIGAKMVYQDIADDDE